MLIRPQLDSRLLLRVSTARVTDPADWSSHTLRSFALTRASTQTSAAGRDERELQQRRPPHRRAALGAPCGRAQRKLFIYSHHNPTNTSSQVMSRSHPLTPSTHRYSQSNEPSQKDSKKNWGNLIVGCVAPNYSRLLGFGVLCWFAHFDAGVYFFPSQSSLDLFEASSRSGL